MRATTECKWEKRSLAMLVWSIYRYSWTVVGDRGDIRVTFVLSKGENLKNYFQKLFIVFEIFKTLLLGSLSQTADTTTANYVRAVRSTGLFNVENGLRR